MKETNHKIQGWNWFLIWKAESCWVAQFVKGELHECSRKWGYVNCWRWTADDKDDDCGGNNDDDDGKDDDGGGNNDDGGGNNDDGGGNNDDGGGNNDDGGGNNDDDDDEEDDRGRVTHTVDQPTGQGRWKPRLWTELSSNLVHLVHTCIMWRLYNICAGIDTMKVNYYSNTVHIECTIKCTMYVQPAHIETNGDPTPGLLKRASTTTQSHPEHTYCTFNTTHSAETSTIHRARV